MIIHETLREQVLDYIREQVLDMRINPGERIIEQEMSNRLNISRGPIREALRQLEQEGLVQYRRNRGCIVRKLSVEDVYEIFLIRAALEAASMIRCQGVFDDQIIREMETNLEDMKKLQDDMQIREFVSLDQQFHLNITKLSKLDKLCKTWDSCTSLNMALFLTDKGKKFIPAIQYAKHKLILDTMKHGDVDAMIKVIYEHYIKTSALFAKDE